MYCMANRRGKGRSSDRFPLVLQNQCRRWLQTWNQKMTASWKEGDNKPRQDVEKQRHYSANKGPYSQDYGLPCGHVQLYELDHKEGRAPKSWCLHTVVLEKMPESPLDSKEIKPVNLKGDQPWIFTEKTDAEVEAPVFWSSEVNRRFIGKVPDARKDWRLKEKRVSDNETAGRNHQCNEHELGQTLGDGEGQEGLACCSPWGHKESDTLGDWTTATLSERGTRHGSNLSPESMEHTLFLFLLHCPEFPLRAIYWISCDFSP